MQTTITRILTDPAARSKAAVEAGLIEGAEVATPWNGLAE
jgi:hypothetical protein